MTSATQSLHAQLQQALSTETATEVLWSIGVALHQQGSIEAAHAAFEAVVKQTADHLSAWHALTVLRLELKLPLAAEFAARNALTLAPNDIDSQFNAGIVHLEQGALQIALGYMECVLQTVPDHAGALRNRPLILLKLGELKAADAAMLDALNVFPNDAVLHFNHGEILLGSYRANEARQAYERALAYAPDFALARYSLAISLAACGDIASAQREQQKALAQEPSLTNSYRSPLALDQANQTSDTAPERVAVLAAFELLRAADLSTYEKAVELYRQLVCGELGNSPLAQLEMAYLSLGLPIDESIRQRLARQVAAKIATEVADIKIVRPQSQLQLQPQRRTRPKITIAYLSADFMPHPMCSLMGDIYARHDREKFRVIAYSVGPINDTKERARVVAGVDAFHDVSHLPAPAIAQRIAFDGVDILIDLSGYTKNTKPAILALRPAPIQVNYMGFIGTLGATCIDYTLLDRTVMLPEVRPYWDEKIAYLPHCLYHCEVLSSPVVLERKTLGLTKDMIVLGALHSPRKFDPHTFQTWFEILREHSGTVLWLLFERDIQIENLRKAALAAGVDPDRLVFAPLVAHEAHLARYREIDIFLDSFAYNGHTTTVDALSMGTPVVTLCGQQVVARVAASMLRAHHLPELIANTVDEYKEIVARLINEPRWRQSIREQTAKYAHSDLFAPERRCREIEAAYEHMWQQHLDGKAPADFDVPPQ